MLAILDKKIYKYAQNKIIKSSYFFTVAVEVTYYLHSVKSSDTTSVFILPDLSAAFDIVDHIVSYFLKHFFFTCRIPVHHNQHLDAITFF